jgi:ABC-type glycerol-3-phosphate transport system substrate-binding protein
MCDDDHLGGVSSGHRLGAGRRGTTYRRGIALFSRSWRRRFRRSGAKRKTRKGAALRANGARSAVIDNGRKIEMARGGRRAVVSAALATGACVIAGMIAGPVGAGAGAATRSQTTPVTFTFGYYGNAEELNVYKAAVSLYEKTHPGVTIQTTYDAPAPYYDKLLTDLRSGTAPDVTTIAESWVQGYISAVGKPFVDLTPYLNSSHVSTSQFVPGTFTPGEVGGQKLILPNVVYGDAVAVNEGLFKKAGIAVPTTWTLAELLSDAKKLTSGTGSGEIYGISEAIQIENTAQLFGGKLVYGDTPGHLTMGTTNPLTVKGITWDVDLVRKYHVAPAEAPSFFETAGAVDPFLTGHAAMDLTYAAYDQASFSQSIGSKFLWTLVPWPSDGHGVLQLNAGAIVRGNHNSPSLYPAEFAFIKWLAEDPQATALQGELASPAYLLAEHKWLTSPPSDWVGVDRSAVNAALARSPYIYGGGGVQQVETDAEQEFDAMLDGKVSVSQGLQTITSEGTAALQSAANQ